MPISAKGSLLAVCTENPQWTSAANEANLEAVPDPEVLAFATQQGRIVVTSDLRTMPRHFGDFLETHGQFAGVFLVKQRVPLADLIEPLVLVRAASHANEGKIGSWRFRSRNRSDCPTYRSSYGPASLGRYVKTMLWPARPSAVITSVSTRGDSVTVPLAVRCGSIGTRTVRTRISLMVGNPGTHVSRLSHSGFKQSDESLSARVCSKGAITRRWSPTFY